MIRFIDNQDNTIFDSRTNLMWEKCGFHHTMLWEDAICYPDKIKVGNYYDWRLPTIEELCTIIDYTQYNSAIDPIFSCYSGGYWSCSTYIYFDDYAWVVGFNDGDVNVNAKSTYYYVRCVRFIK